mmetsp:Transcript_35195/g.74926  ORF Transcript_35195/g.74926 Transcript_35195/m.74926 type:complete len:508 (+) Transcript_35195:95-1618(+)
MADKAAAAPMLFLSTICLSLLGIDALTTAGQQSQQQQRRQSTCFDRPQDFAGTLDVGVGPDQAQYQNFSVPPISQNISDYAYATENAFILLPSVCVSRLNLEPNIGDANRIIGQWMGRRADLDEALVGVSLAARDEILSECACGWAIFLHGSGGFTFDNSRYSIMMAASGYGVLALDSFASPASKLRWKAPLPSLASRLSDANGEVRTLTFWCENNVYEKESACPAAMAKSNESSYPLCYSSSSKAILSDPEGWSRYYERVYRVRQLEMDYAVEHLPNYIREAGKVFLVGESEGGMAASRYHHPELEELLKSGGRIILQWSCEKNYFVSCEANARIGSGHANSDTPILNMISAKDPFFATSASIASEVANAAGGYGSNNLTGNCFAEAARQGFSKVTVMNFLNTEYHGLTVDTGNLVRVALKAFLRDPTSFAASRVVPEFGRDGAGLCEVVKHLPGMIELNCTELGDEARVNASEVSDCSYPTYRFHHQYYDLGVHEICGRPQALFV